MRPLRSKYLQLLETHGLTEPERPVSNADGLQIINSLLSSNDEHDASVANDANQIFSMGMFSEILNDNSFLAAQPDNAVDKYSETIVHFYAKRGFAIGESIYFNEFPTGSFNAEIVHLDEGYLCLINTGLLRLVYKIAYCILNPVRGDFSGELNSLGISLDTDVSESDMAFRNAITCLVDRCYMFLIKGNLNPGMGSRPSGSMDPATFMALNNLTIGMKSFVVAHEIGHCYLGHLRHANVCRRITPHGDIDALNINHQMEHEADTDAIKTLIMMDAEQNLFIPYYFGPLAFFYIQIILEILASKFIGAPVDLHKASTHPPTPSRIRGVKEYLRKTLDNKSYEKVERLEYPFYLAADSILRSKITISGSGPQVAFADV